MQDVTNTQPGSKHAECPGVPGMFGNNQFLVDFLLAALGFLVVYGYLIFRFGLISDEVWNLCGDDQSLFAASGRWGTVLYRYIFSVKIVPYAYGMACTLFYSLAIALQIKALGIRGLCERAVYITFSLGMIQISYLMSYSGHVDTICMGILATTAAYYLVFAAGAGEKGGVPVWRWLVAIPLMALGMGVYQTIAILPLCLWLGKKLIYFKDETLMAALKECPKMLLLYTAAPLLYFCISHICKMYAPVDVIERVATYQSQLTGWSGEFKPGKRYLCSYILAHIAGRHQGEWVYTISLIPALLLVLKCVLGKRETALRKMVLAALALGLYLYPLIPILVMRWDSAPRLFICMPFVCGILWAAAIAHNPPCTLCAKRALLWGCALLCGFVILKASYAVSASAYIQKRQYEDVAKQLEEVRIRALLTPVPEEVDAFTCPIILAGPMEQRHPSVEQGLVINLKLSKWLSLTRTEMCRHFGRDDMYDAADSRIPKEKLDSILSTMPLYPAKGSTRYVDGEIIVKLGEKE